MLTYPCPVGETMRGFNRSKSKYQGCSLDDEDDWHQFRNGKAFLSPIVFIAYYLGENLTWLGS